MTASSLKVLILWVVVAAASAKVVKFHRCSGVPKDRCTVSEVRITPCLKSKCELVRGENASISFDFTPSFATDKLKTGIFWQNTPFGDMSDDACEISSCPTVAGTQQTATYNLYIADKYPKGKFTIAFKVWNADDDHNDVCCFETNIYIPDKKSN